LIQRKLLAAIGLLPSFRQLNLAGNFCCNTCADFRMAFRLMPTTV